MKERFRYFWFYYRRCNTYMPSTGWRFGTVKTRYGSSCSSLWYCKYEKNGRKPLIEFKLKGLVYESWLVYEHRLPMIVQPSPRKTTPLPYLYTFKSKRCCADFAIDRKSCSGLRCGQEHSYIIYL